MARDFERTAPLTGDVGVDEEGHLHSHPLPEVVRLVLIIYGLMLGITFIAVLSLIYTSAHNAATDRARLRKAVDQEITAHDAETRRRVCAVLGSDTASTVSANQLRIQLGCYIVVRKPVPGSTVVPVPGGVVTIVPVPVPGPVGSTGPTGPPGPAASPAASPSPHPSSTPTAYHSPTPSPTPCGVVNHALGRC